jgi:hypothetical protein
MLFGFPRRDQARSFSAFRVDNKQETANPANCLPSCFTRCIAFTTVNTLDAVWIGKHKLSVFKADFVFQLVFRIFVFVSYDPAIFHVFSVLLFVLLVKVFLKIFLSGPRLRTTRSRGMRDRRSPATQGGAWVVREEARRTGLGSYALFPVWDLSNPRKTLTPKNPPGTL